MAVYAIAAIIAIAAVALAAYLLYQNGSGSSTQVPFSVFKSNLASAQRVSLLLEFSNNTQLDYELQCSTTILQMMSSTRSPKTIDFFEVNQTSCSYSHGLGYPINLTNPSTSTCVSDAQLEPGISLNYSAMFSNTITADHMYIQGNSTYFKGCPIAVDLR